MTELTEVKSRIIQLPPAMFEEFCSTLLYKEGHKNIYELGIKAGTGKTKIGNPDTYSRNNNGKYTFVVFTTQQNKIYDKLLEDISKCFDLVDKELPIEKIETIICCHTSSNLKVIEDNKLHEFCNKKGVNLEIYGIDKIANLVYNDHPELMRSLNLNINTNQILPIDDFVKLNDNNLMTAPLNTVFYFREEELQNIINSLKNSSVVIIGGKSGVGKTRLALEVAKSYEKNRDYKIFCVKSNNLEIYNDLVSKIKKGEKYLFLVDDANELKQFNLMLEYVNKLSDNYHVKIIATVRDYIKQEVINLVREYTNPITIDIAKFTDDEIKELIENNFGIRNNLYVEQIIRISEGIPRFAYMAGKLAIEKQNLSSISDASQLYENYYRRHISKLLEIDRSVLITAGILAFNKSIKLQDLEFLKEFLIKLGISIFDFKNAIDKLNRMEFIDVKKGKVAIFDDQCFSNYMLYYVFLDEKLIKLSDIIEVFYIYSRSRAIEALNTILNIFRSEKTLKYIKKEILKVWDKFEEEKSQYYESFVRDFHIYNPIKGFRIADENIKSIKEKEFNITEIDFDRRGFYNSNSPLEYLTGYQNSNELLRVYQLLMKYASKTSSTLIESYNWLESYYGLQPKSTDNTQKIICEYLLEDINKGNSNAMAIGYMWTKYLLSYSFESIIPDKNNSFKIRSWNIDYDSYTSEHRKVSWYILNSLVSKLEWKDKVLAFLGKFADKIYYNNSSNEIDIKILEEDLVQIENILSECRTTRIGYLKVLSKILNSVKKLGKSFKGELEEYLIGKEWEIYSLFRNDRRFSEMNIQGYKDYRKEQILKYFSNKKNIDEVELVSLVDSMLEDPLIKEDTHHINQAFTYLINNSDVYNNKKLFNSIINSSGNIDIQPNVILRKILNNHNYKEILTDLKNTDANFKNKWIYFYFEILPAKCVDTDMYEELVNFIKFDIKNNKIYYSRNLSFLEKFLIINSNIYIEIYKIILENFSEKKDASCYYLEDLFEEGLYTPEKLLLLYKDEVEVLYNIYFKLLEEGITFDYTGEFFIEFLKNNEEFLKKYIDILIIRKAWGTGNEDGRIERLWKSKNFIEYFDLIFYKMLESNIDYCDKASFASELFSNTSDEEIVKKNQYIWLEHIIKENANKENIVNIFNVICGLSEDQRRFAIKAFLENNHNFETFKKLPLFPIVMSGFGSLINSYRKRIDFIQSLYPLMEDIEFLDHVEYLTNIESNLKSEIDRTETEDLYEGII
ncbi:nSTAND3 domain-containing NTPase [Gemella sp.]